jgi:hypothetical protein
MYWWVTYRFVFVQYKDIRVTGTRQTAKETSCIGFVLQAGVRYVLCNLQCISRFESAWAVQGSIVDLFTAFTFPSPRAQSSIDLPHSHVHRLGVNRRPIYRIHMSIVQGSIVDRFTAFTCPSSRAQSSIDLPHSHVHRPGLNRLSI